VTEVDGTSWDVLGNVLRAVLCASDSTMVISIPVSWFICAEYVEIGFEYLVNSFRFFISLRVIGCAHSMIDFE
jgi:hypothetical protein